MKPRSSTKNNGTGTSTATIIDDPCWGDPEHCSLEYLLSLLKKDDTILYESSDYIFMNKPADLRMDGPYPATVHKLITYWYPPPSLQSLSKPDLLEHLTTKHRHCDVQDNEWRPCHQLDYATSGVLLLGQSAQAANHACTCFGDRQVEKSYVAVLHGHVTFANRGGHESRRTDIHHPPCIITTSTTPATSNSIHSNFLPTICPERLAHFVKNQELQYRRLKQKRRSDTFQGYQPPQAFLQIYTGRYNRLQGTAIRKRKRNEKLNDEQWNQVDQALQLEPKDRERLATYKFQDLKRQKDNQHLMAAVERATECYNTILRYILYGDSCKVENMNNNNNTDDSEEELPTIFRVEGDDDSIFYVYLPLAQVGDEFAMRIPARHVATSNTDGPGNNKTATATPTPTPTPTWLQPGDESTLNFKQALTKCTILQYAFLKGRPVTKVRLEPRTGRRHQLRVHSAFVGHPIVGDQTYEYQGPVGEEVGSETGISTFSANPSGLSHRMCLHAFTLSLPMPNETTKQESSKDGEMKTSNNPEIPAGNKGLGTKRLLATAPDPFIMSKDGELTVINM